MKKLLNNKKNQTIILIILCITILLLGIGYIFLSVALKKQYDKVNVFDVEFTDIQKYSSIKGSNIEPTGSIDITSEGTMLNCKFVLSSFNDELTYIVKIKNRGNIKAQIVKLVSSPDYSLDSFRNLISPVTISLSDIEGKTLDVNEEIELKISVYYNPSSKKASKKTIDYNLGIITKSTN